MTYITQIWPYFKELPGEVWIILGSAIPGLVAPDGARVPARTTTNLLAYLLVFLALDGHCLKQDNSRDSFTDCHSKIVT